MGYTWGRDLNQAAPEEAVRLVEPIMEDLFVEAYEQRRLLQLAYDDNARRRSGPIVCCMDTSASMNTSAALEWERFLWCKGMGLALLDLARREGRSFLGICFSGEHNVEQFVVTVGGYLPEIAVEMAQCDFNGGTHFERPLQLSVEHIQTHKEKDADLIMITDGEASLKNSFIEEFRRQKVSLGIRLYTVFIDGTHGGLRGISDATFTVRSDRVDSWESAVTEIGRRLK